MQTRSRCQRLSGARPCLGSLVRLWHARHDVIAAYCDLAFAYAVQTRNSKRSRWFGAFPAPRLGELRVDGWLQDVRRWVTVSVSRECSLSRGSSKPSVAPATASSLISDVPDFEMHGVLSPGGLQCAVCVYELKHICRERGLPFPPTMASLKRRHDSQRKLHINGRPIKSRPASGRC